MHLPATANISEKPLEKRPSQSGQSSSAKLITEHNGRLQESRLAARALCRLYASFRNDCAVVSELSIMTVLTRINHRGFPCDIVHIEKPKD